MARPPADLAKLHPKLRMILNGSSTVNIVRSEHCSALFVNTEVARKRVKLSRGDLDAPKTRRELRGEKRGKLTKAASDVSANVLVQLSDPTSPLEHGLTASASRGSFATVSAPLDRIPSLTKGAVRVELAEALTDPSPKLEVESTQPRPRRNLQTKVRHRDGQGVLIGIIDVQGFDFAHPDFLDPKGNTRFVAIWDQGGHNRPPPKPYHYGSELTRQQLTRAIRESSQIGAPATSLEPQSQQVPGSHGTHVASIAAGNRGVCAKADIAAVLISMGHEQADERSSFYDSSRLLHAVEYLVALAEKRKQPLSINISLGTNGHAHDGSSVLSRWLDSMLAKPGLSLCAAAGNAGQEKAEREDDLGFVMGRIHTSGRIPSAGLDMNIGWIVVGNGKADLSENELHIWHSAQDRFSISIKPPGGAPWIGPVKPGEYIENRELPDGTFVSIYNEPYHPANGENLIGCYLTPFFSKQGSTGVTAGEWTVQLHGLEVRDGHYHAWIERDDPRRIGTVGDKEAWTFPSFFSESSSVDNSSINSLACTHFVLSVGNLDEAVNRINITSSQGPTRDGRAKPDLAAPGTNIVAAKGFAGADDLWVSMSGTSMASPMVAGVVGLMLSVAPSLTAAQVRGIMRRTARPLPGAGYTWLNDAGYGVIRPQEAIEEAANFSRRKDITR
ncbi:MAG: S8 family serine peptidase [Myxococcales bacterium]